MPRNQIIYLALWAFVLMYAWRWMQARRAHG